MLCQVKSKADSPWWCRGNVSFFSLSEPREFWWSCEFQLSWIKTQNTTSPLTHTHTPFKAQTPTVNHCLLCCTSYFISSAQSYRCWCRFHFIHFLTPIKRPGLCLEMSIFENESCHNDSQSQQGRSFVLETPAFVCGELLVFWQNLHRFWLPEHSAKH